MVFLIVSSQSPAVFIQLRDALSPSLTCFQSPWWAASLAAASYYSHFSVAPTSPRNGGCQTQGEFVFMRKYSDFVFWAGTSECNLTFLDLFSSWGSSFLGIMDHVREWTVRGSEKSILTSLHNHLPNKSNISVLFMLF